MPLRTLLLLAGFMVLAGGGGPVHASTSAEECQKRALSAYEKGTSEEDKQQRGAAAASLCFKEMDEALEKKGALSGIASISLAGPMIFLLLAGGFLGYRLATRGNRPMSERDIGQLRTQVRALYCAEASDSVSVRRFKQHRLQDAEQMFAAALSGELPITPNSMKGSIAHSRQELQDYTASSKEVLAKVQCALDAQIKVRDAAKHLLATQPNDPDSSQERELRKAMEAQLATAIQMIDTHERELAAERA